MDEDPFRSPWEEDELPEAAPGRPLAGTNGLLIPLARAQDAVARLEASVAAAPEHVAAGLRARLALFEAAGYLAHRGAAVHPHDLALRDANLTGSYTVAAITGRLKATTPWTMEQAGEGPLPDDHVVANALAYARLWRRLAELATVQPLASVDTLAAPLAQLGAHLSDDEPTRTWLQALPGPADLPGLLAAAKVMATGLPRQGHGNWAAGRGAGRAARARRILCGGRALATARLRPGLRAALLVGAGVPDRGPGASGRVWFPAYLPSMWPRRRQRGARELARLHAASRRLAALPASGHSRLPEAGAVALREPLVTGRLLARTLGVSSRAGLDLATRLVQAGVLREMTGRAAWPRVRRKLDSSNQAMPCRLDCYVWPICRWTKSGIFAAKLRCLYPQHWPELSRLQGCCE